MPQYHIFSRGIKTKGPYNSEGIISGDGARKAWNKYKRWAKTNGKDVDPLKEYQLYPINHCRVWNYKNGKWVINSFYGNHNAKEYRKEQSKRMKQAHQHKQQVLRQSMP